MNTPATIAVSGIKKSAGTADYKQISTLIVDGLLISLWAFRQTIIFKPVLAKCLHYDHARQFI